MRTRADPGAKFIWGNKGRNAMKKKIRYAVAGLGHIAQINFSGNCSARGNQTTAGLRIRWDIAFAANG
jgi:hypothetical protein